MYLYFFLNSQRIYIQTNVLAILNLKLFFFLLLTNHGDSQNKFEKLLSPEDYIIQTDAESKALSENEMAVRKQIGNVNV